MGRLAKGHYGEHQANVDVGGHGHRGQLYCGQFSKITVSEWSLRPLMVSQKFRWSLVMNWIKKNNVPGTHWHRTALKLAVQVLSIADFH